ncbi:MAG: YueI family protein [Bacillota bacterium]|nr:YueI family protein [Bacillota bacterium]
MQKPSLDELLQQGILGPKEIKPEERKRFLGTLRERILVALKKGQVKEIKVYPEVEKLMKTNPEAHLFLNGHMRYEEFSKYVTLAKKYKIEHTIVANKEHDTDIGLVLAMDHAIDKADIYIEKKEPKILVPEKASIFSKLFKRKK